jgi:hypothetical protein
MPRPIDRRSPTFPPFSPPSSPHLTKLEETSAYLKACGVMELG